MATSVQQITVGSVFTPITSITMAFPWATSLVNNGYQFALTFHPSVIAAYG